MIRHLGRETKCFIFYKPKHKRKLNIVYLWVAVILIDNQLPFLFSETANTAQKERGIKMIENKNDASRNLEKALFSIAEGNAFLLFLTVHLINR